MNKSKTFLKRVTLWICWLAFFLPLTSVAQAQEVNYDITDVYMTGDIQADGSTDFQEIYTFDIDYINGIYHRVDYGDLAIRDYRIGVIDSDQNQIRYLTESLNGLPDTYRISDDGSILTFQIFYPASDEVVEFVIEYTLDDVITNYQDTAEINRKLIGSNTDDRFDFQARINLPGEVQNTEDFRAWGYGANNGEVYPITENGESYIEMTVKNNPPNQFIELNAIFPTSLTPNNQNIVDEPQKDAIIQRSNDIVEADRKEFEQQKQMLMLLMGVGIIAFPVVTIFVWFYYLRQRRKLNPEPAMVPEHMYSLPEEITPAIMATTVLRREAIADDFSATIIDLARKGYLQIEEITEETEGFLRRKKTQTVRISRTDLTDQTDDLMKHERYVLSYLLDSGDSITLAEIEDRIKESTTYQKEKNRIWTNFKKFTYVIGTKVRNEPPQVALSVAFTILSMAAGIVVPVLLLMILEGSVYFDYWPYIVGVAAVNFLANFILMVMIFMRPIKTYQQDKRQREWRAFKRMLEDVGNMNMREIASLPLWEEFLAYAVSLDVADKVVAAMSDQYGVEELRQDTHLPTVFYHNPYWINNVVRPSVGNTISAATPSSSGNYSGSNSGGFGGGFSSGSSGGGGGGGGTGGF